MGGIGVAGGDSSLIVRSIISALGGFGPSLENFEEVASTSSGSIVRFTLPGGGVDGCSSFDTS